MDKIKIAGYVKLAKWWERSRESALTYHESYYKDMFAKSEIFTFVGVYVDITGNKDIYKRKEMLRLIKDCREGKVDCIMAMTKGYLAANMRDFSYLFKYLMDIRQGAFDFMTEDENDMEDVSGFYIDTIKNEDDQKDALIRMTDEFVSLYPQDYEAWKRKVEAAIEEIGEC